MKKLKYSLAAKIIACILFVIFLSTALFGTICIAYWANSGLDRETNFYESQACERITSKYTNMVYYDYLLLIFQSKTSKVSTNIERQLKHYDKMFSPENTNFMFTVSDYQGRVILSNYQAVDKNAEIIWCSDPEGWIDKANGDIYNVNDLVKSHVKDITAKDDYYLPFMIFSTLYSLKSAMLPAVLVSVLLALLLFMFLMFSWGNKKDKDNIHLNFIDKIPLDLLAFFALIFLSVLYSTSSFRWGISSVREIVMLCIFIVAASFMFLLLSTTFAARVKAGKWWRNMVVYRVPNWLWKIISRIIGNLPLLWKTILVFLAYLFVNGFLVLILYTARGPFTVFFGFLFNMCVLFGLCCIILQLNRLKLAGERIAAGDYETKIDTKNLLWDIKSHAETLNTIGNGTSKAVEERLKSERLKTELITNVSHDIKTPLTSIINYVDLLRKEQIDNENVQEYLEILDRQSLRLKKLTVDLVDASKASTGNIPVNPERIDTAEFLNQSVGEYSERFTACGLETLISTPGEKAYINADGRLLWRVFDNLFNNTSKYAMPNTRVYLDVEKFAGKVIITLKNISRYPLNITPDELMERFVRGDASRSTDGSGLGLSIAKSLTELMKGSFELSVDGDLFKVTMKFESLGD